MFRLFRMAPSKTEAAPLPRFAYRLRRRPELVHGHRTVGVLRAITRMELTPVSREWFERTTQLAADDAELLLLDLVAQGAVEELDLARDESRTTAVAA